MRPASIREELECDGCLVVAGLDETDLWVEVAADEHTATYVTDRQRSTGSLLVLPRRHVAWVGDLQPGEAEALAAAIWRAAQAVREVYGPDGMHLFTGSGSAAGQSMFHMHFQVTPRYEGAPYSFAPSTEVPLTPLADRTAQASALIAALSGAAGR